MLIVEQLLVCCQIMCLIIAQNSIEPIIMYTSYSHGSLIIITQSTALPCPLIYVTQVTFNLTHIRQHCKGRKQLQRNQLNNKH